MRDREREREKKKERERERAWVRGGSTARKHPPKANRRANNNGIKLANAHTQLLPNPKFTFRCPLNPTSQTPKFTLTCPLNPTREITEETPQHAKETPQPTLTQLLYEGKRHHKQY